MHALNDRRVLGRLAKGAAPIDRWNEQRVAAGVVGRAVPLHAAQKTRATMHTFYRRYRIDVLARRDGNLIELLLAASIEQSQQSVLAANRDRVMRLAIDYRRKQGTDLAEIGVVHIVGNELAIPQELAGLGIKGDQ